MEENEKVIYGVHVGGRLVRWGDTTRALIDAQAVLDGEVAVVLKERPDPSRQWAYSDGTVTAYQPPAPADTEWATYAWDADAWAWAPSPTTAALARDARVERDRRLAACDWVVARATERGEPVPAAWVAYREALRDVPEQPGFPQVITWPTIPS